MSPEQDPTASAQQARMIAMQKLVQEGFYEVELPGREHNWSSRLLEILGLPTDFEPSDESFRALIYPDDRERVFDAINRHLNDRVPCEVSFRALHPEKQHVELLLRGQGRWNDVGEPIGIIGAVTDISETEEALQRYREVQRRFTDLADNIPGAIYRYIRRPDGVDEIEYMSHGCADIWELSDVEIKGDPSKLWDQTVPEDLPGLAASVERSARELSKWLHRWHVISPSGKRKCLEGHGTPSVQADGSVVWNSLILDVTVEETAQAELEQNLAILYESQKQESLGRIAGGIAHDFNNLLAIIMGNAELLADKVLPDVAEDRVSEILQAARKGGDLTRRLLSFARRSALEPSVLSLNSVVRDMSSLLGRALPQTIELSFDLADDLPAIKVDKAFLESSLLNIVVNARDAMPDGGRIKISTEERDVRKTTRLPGGDIGAGHYVVLTVEDSGEGIDPELLPSIFEPFVSSKSKDQGTGLGLSMVFGFARQSGGAVRADSELGKGTTMRVFLPVTDEERESTQQHELLLEQADLERCVLLVEDQDGVRNVCRAILESANFRVIEATSGDEALEVALRRSDEIDLVLTDIIMPGTLQGSTLAAELRRTRIDVPVIFMSGYPGTAGERLSPDDVTLIKPIDRNTLLTAVSRALQDGSRA